MEIKPENKFCQIIFDRKNYSLSIISANNGLRSYGSNTKFLVPMREFLSCGSIWRELNLCTIFWESLPYNRVRDNSEIQKTKIAYIIAFASDLAPICKRWANDCLEKTINYKELNDSVYFEIEVFNENLKEKIMNAIQSYNLNYSVNNNIHTVY